MQNSILCFFFFQSDLSSRFYTLIPHSFGRNIPPPINTQEKLKTKMRMLEALADIEIAVKQMKAAEDVDGNILDAKYDSLKTDINYVEPGSDEFKLINDYVKNSQEANFPIQMIDLYSIERHEEPARFEPSKAIGNRRLLWHGSRLTNYVGILSTGLRIAPPEAPCSGYRFGKGMYFADVMSLSARYCRANNSPFAVMLLCDVALGNMYDCPRDKYMDQPPNGFDSTKALGVIEPDPKKNVEHPEGFIIPSGPIVPSGYSRNEVACHEHQYVSYDVSRVQIRYLMKVKFGK